MPGAEPGTEIEVNAADHPLLGFFLRRGDLFYYDTLRSISVGLAASQSDPSESAGQLAPAVTSPIRVAAHPAEGLRQLWDDDTPVAIRSVRGEDKLFYTWASNEVAEVEKISP